MGCAECHRSSNPGTELINGVGGWDRGFARRCHSRSPGGEGGVTNPITRQYFALLPQPDQPATSLRTFPAGCGLHLCGTRGLLRQVYDHGAQ